MKEKSDHKNGASDREKGNVPESNNGDTEKVSENGEIFIDADKYNEMKAKAAERDEYYNKWLKVYAEYENTLKRLEKEKIDRIKFANEGMITQLIPLVDNFDMALDAMEKAEDKEAVMDGIRLVAKEFHRILEDNGVAKIKTGGEMFDPNVHEAVAAVDTDKYDEGTVVEEIRAGYLLNSRLLRPAQVKVAHNTCKDDGETEK